MKIIVLLIAFIVVYLWGRKVVVIHLEPLKADWLRIKKAAAWMAIQFKALKSKFTKKQ